MLAGEEIKRENYRFVEEVYGPIIEGLIRDLEETGIVGDKLNIGDRLKSLPVASVADKSCALWLWTPTHHLIRGITYEVCEAWGFRPMTTMIWCKPQIGLGHYIRNAHEPVLLAVKGSYKLKVKDQPSWFIADRTTHSKKPARFYRIVEALCHEPRLELFSRTPKDGWTVWGNELHDPLGWGYDPEGWKDDNSTNNTK